MGGQKIAKMRYVICEWTLTLWQKQVSFFYNFKVDQSSPALCINVHRFVMFPLTLQQKKFLLGRHLKSDQISPTLPHVTGATDTPLQN